MSIEKASSSEPIRISEAIWKDICVIAGTTLPSLHIAKAREYLNRDNFDMILLDLRLPDGGGTELLKQISCDHKSRWSS